VPPAQSRHVSTNFIVSYKKFVTDLNEFYKDKKNNETHYEIAQKIIRDNWLDSSRYDELISFTLKNWDSGNCDDFIEPLEEKLIIHNHLNKFKLLWTKILIYRITNLIDSLTGKKNIQLNEIELIDVSDFNMYSVESYSDANRVLAFRRDFVLKGIEKYKNGLLRLHDQAELEKIMQLEIAVKNLDKANIKKEKLVLTSGFAAWLRDE